MSCYIFKEEISFLFDFFTISIHFIVKLTYFSWCECVHGVASSVVTSVMLYVKHGIYVVSELSSALRIHCIYVCMLYYWLQHMFAPIQINKITVEPKRVSKLCCDISSSSLCGGNLRRFPNNGMKRVSMDSIDNKTGTNSKQGLLWFYFSVEFTCLSLTVYRYFSFVHYSEFSGTKRSTEWIRTT